MKNPLPADVSFGEFKNLITAFSGPYVESHRGGNLEPKDQWDLRLHSGQIGDGLGVIYGAPLQTWGIECAL